MIIGVYNSILRKVWFIIDFRRNINLEKVKCKELYHNCIKVGLDMFYNRIKVVLKSWTIRL